MPNFAQPMDTVFVKKVHPNSPAFLAGLQEGDRLLAVNGLSVASLPYAQVVATIQQTPKTLTLQVVPKNYDLLQTVSRVWSGQDSCSENLLRDLEKSCFFTWSYLAHKIVLHHHKELLAL